MNFDELAKQAGDEAREAALLSRPNSGVEGIIKLARRRRRQRGGIVFMAALVVVVLSVPRLPGPSVRIDFAPAADAPTDGEGPQPQAPTEHQCTANARVPEAPGACMRLGSPPSPTVKASATATVVTSCAARGRRQAAVVRLEAPAPIRLSSTDEFGLVTTAARTSSGIEISVDRVQMLAGEKARREAEKRGEDFSNDYFLVNDNPQVREYQVSADTCVWGNIGFGYEPGDPQPVAVDDFFEFVRTDRARHTLFHFQVKDGLVVGIEEQYRP